MQEWVVDDTTLQLQKDLKLGKWYSTHITRRWMGDQNLIHDNDGGQTYQIIKKTRLGGIYTKCKDALPITSLQVTVFRIRVQSIKVQIHHRAAVGEKITTGSILKKYKYATPHL